MPDLAFQRLPLILISLQELLVFSPAGYAYQRQTSHMRVLTILAGRTIGYHGRRTHDPLSNVP
jgi:hypothetical protein